MRFPLIALILVPALVAGTMIYAQDKNESSELPVEIIINNPGYPKDTKGPVTFPHSDHSQKYHFKYSCGTCHHVFQDGRNIWTDQDPVQGCVECHPYEQTEGQARSLLKAYHGSCRECHMSMIYQDIARGVPYQKCERCHQEKK